jgi:glutamate/tyrosine decarboxylase-like PLP-dependent enzyme
LTLPDFSPEALEEMLARVSGMAVKYQEDLPNRESFRRPPEEVVKRFEMAPLPQRGLPAELVFDEIERDVLPYSLGIGHPRWWGYIRASPSPMGIAADLLATTMNNNCSGSAQIATYVEMTVMRWLAELIGYDPSCGGILLSGGSAANFVALAAMREAKLPGTRSRGLVGAQSKPTVYVTHETHSCIRRAVEMLGLGSDSLRLIPIDQRRRMDIHFLENTIAKDRDLGYTPLCLVGTAGTVNSGAIDPLEEMHLVARRENLWFHVDGAFGAVGAAIPELASEYVGLSSADSIAIDPHKWLYIPYEAGAVLVRDRNALTRAFATRAAYLEVQDNSYFSGPLWYYQQGPQLSRAFRALKVWAVMRQIGVEGYRELWRRDLEAAAELRQLAKDHPKLELVGISGLSIVCFRYLPVSGDPDAFNRRLVDLIQKDGRLFVSGTSVDDAYCLRAAIVNFHTTLADVRLAVEAIVELGEGLEGGQTVRR